ncbi:ABC transporter ATP-binding protein [Methanobrevibacter sp.]|uniref:ABC transporter ATP-binding protein n=1 Tax=Methanobrevibacter sp. TaxID=66852 RepID=UPI00388E7715
MSTQMRYPKNTYQDSSHDGGEWKDLDNVLIDDWESLACCTLSPNQKPNSFVVTNFKFNIPQDSIIHAVDIRLDFHRDSSPNSIDLEPPAVRLINVKDEYESKPLYGPTVSPIERSVLFDGSKMSPADLNSPDFGVEIIFDENESEFSGDLFFDFVRISINYEEQRFVLGSLNGEGFPVKEKPLQKSIGETFIYTVLFNNSNGINKNPQDVKINLPEGLEVVNHYFGSDKKGKIDVNDIDYEEDRFDFDKLTADQEIIYDDDEIDLDTLIWHTGVKGRGMSRLRLELKCVGEGFKELSAFNKFSGTGAHFYVEVHPEGYEHEPNVYEESLLKWKSQLDVDEDYQNLNKEVVIEVNNINREFDKAQEKVDNLKEYVIKWLKRELKPKTKFKALTDVSFTVNKGERVGIIGFNGAGKSTLLKILSGVLRPNSGSIHINGKVAPLLELGAGFDHNYSGRENVFLNGAILGYSREFLESKYEEIVEFSELEEFMELPIKNYSSGMIAKLGFAVATLVEPEILILDEILSVGDVRFQKKSGDKLKSMMNTGTTVLLVSHSVGTIRSMCNRVIWLDHGKIVMDGLTRDVCDAYVEAAKKASDDELSGLDI